jgi:hypothetical protein
MEKWKSIIGYEGLYEVSNLGRVRRSHYLNKLSVEAVEKARQLRASGQIYTDIANHFGVTQRAIIKALNVPLKCTALRTPNRILKLQKDGHGYWQIGLWKHGKGTLRQVHILVANAFLGIPPEGCEVNHKNGKKYDSRVDNLEYVTHQQNCLHSYHVLGNSRHLLTPRRKNIHQ